MLSPQTNVQRQSPQTSNPVFTDIPYTQNPGPKSPSTLLESQDTVEKAVLELIQKGRIQIINNQIKIITQKTTNYRHIIYAGR